MINRVFFYVSVVLAGCWTDCHSLRFLLVYSDSKAAEKSMEKSRGVHLFPLCFSAFWIWCVISVLYLLGLLIMIKCFLKLNFSSFLCYRWAEFFTTSLTVNLSTSYTHFLASFSRVFDLSVYCPSIGGTFVFYITERLFLPKAMKDVAAEPIVQLSSSNNFIALVIISIISCSNPIKTSC